MKNLREILTKNLFSKNNEVFGIVILHKNTPQKNKKKTEKNGKNCGKIPEELAKDEAITARL